MEAKLDMVLMSVNPNGKDIIKKIDDDYNGRDTDPFYPGNKT